MDRHILGQTGITTSHLGFGCVQLTSHADRCEAVSILEHAYALGITHFDVSRIYGFGRAEGILGEFIRGRRAQVTIATKFGIQPPAGLAGNRRVIDFAKRVLGPFPGLLRRVKQRGSQMVQSGIFTPQAAVESLEASLRELGTDFVDIFLLHEATLADAASEELIETLQRQVERGTVRCFGVASALQKLGVEAGAIPSAYKVLQFESSVAASNVAAKNVAAKNMAALEQRGNRTLITHTVFQPLRSLPNTLTDLSILNKNFPPGLRLDPADPNLFGDLALQCALRANPKGVVLFSSKNRHRVTHNVRVAELRPYGDEQLDAFASFFPAGLFPDALFPSGQGDSVTP